MSPVAALAGPTTTARPAATTRARAEHDWRVVAPWYRWERRDGTEPERAAEAGAPVLQKFVSSAFVAEFLADPQRSVVFDAALDVLQRVENIPAAELHGPDGRLRSLSRRRLVATTTRKLFLPAHQRFYLLTAGLHCAAPGFPKVDPASVEEAGFVVRRRQVRVPRGKRAEGAALLAAVSQARAVAQSRHELDAARARARLLHPFTSAERRRVASPGAATAAAYREVELARRRLRAWAATEGVEHETEGWVASGEGSLGAWVPVPDEPEELLERSYPMRVLTADPVDPDHAARHGTILFGAVPTGSDETTARGSNRFSELDTYEIRVWVRRRGCGDCPGELVWSAPTPAYRLASFFDPAGCALRPLEVRLPDFAELEAATAMPSVRMTQPRSSMLDFSKIGEIPTKGAVRTPEQICFFSIPLITIIAMFVLNLFLPVVMFVFQLWWMLKLKLCIPPSVQLEADLAAELDVEPPELKVVAGLDVDVLPGVDQGALRGLLAQVFDPPAAADLDPVPLDWRLGQRVTGAFSNDPLLKLAVRNGYGSSSDPAPTYAVPVERHPRVRRDQVVHP